MIASTTEKRQHVVNTGPIASRSRRSRQSLSNISTTTGKRSPKTTGANISHGPGTPPSSSAQAVPPLPASPALAQPSSRASRPLPPAPARPATTPQPSANRVPQIQLQEATPDNYGFGTITLPVPTKTINASPDRESAPPSPSPLQYPTIDPPAAPVSAPSPSPVPGRVAPSPPLTPFDSSAPPVLPIQIPQTGDAAMQQFFHDIVGQLQTISLRNSLPPSPMGSPVIGYRGSSYLGSAPQGGGRDSMVSQASSNGAHLPVISSGGDQFEDAEDDQSDAGSSSQMTPYSPFPTPSLGDQDLFRSRATSPSPVRPLSIASPGGQAPLRPRLAVRGSSREPPSFGRPGSRSSGHENVYTGDKENMPARPSVSYGPTFSKRVPPPKAPRPGAGGDRERATLGLAIQNVASVPTAGSPPFDYEMVEIPDSPTALKGHKNIMRRRKRRCLHQNDPCYPD